MDKVVWIINQYASHLEERHLCLAKGFASKGYKTIIITSSFHHGAHRYLYNEKLHVEERDKNVVYAYIHAEPPYFTNGGKRILNMIGFCKQYLSLREKIEQIFGAPDYVIGSSAPPFMWEVSYSTSKYYDAKFIAEFRDIWPQSLIEVQGVSKYNPLVLVFDIIEKRAYRRANAIVGTMPFAYKHVSEELGFPREKVFWMPNGLDLIKADSAINNREISLPNDLDKFLSDNDCCIYIGSIVKSENVDYIINAWKQVTNPDICLAIVGEGNQTPYIDELLSRENQNKVKHFPAITKEQIPLALEKAKCCLAACQDYPIYNNGLSMNKLSDYLYSGKPTVFACNYNNVVEEAGHFVVRFGNPKDMANSIEKVFDLDSNELNALSAKSKRLIRSQYDYSIISQNYISMLESL